MWRYRVRLFIVGFRRSNDLRLKSEAQLLEAIKVFLDNHRQFNKSI